MRRITKGVLLCSVGVVLFLLTGCMPDADINSGSTNRQNLVHGKDCQFVGIDTYITTG